MSQIVTRKGPVGEDKEKGQATDTPVKEMKKKMAANAEKEKQAAEKHAEKDKDKDKDKDKQTEAKQPEKAEKSVEKTSDKKEKLDKSAEKKEKQAEKEKVAEKKEKQVEKEKAAEKKNEAPADKPKEDKTAKVDKPDDKEKEREKERDTKERDKKRTDTPKPKQNGARANGVPPTPAATPAPATANGDHSDGTVSSDEELVIIDHERDDMFPELAYDDSDGEFEPPTPEGLPSRSYTRRSQAKAARTPETPRPASERRADRDADDSKESKVLKLKEDAPATDRKLRSSDSPKPDAKTKEKKGGEEGERPSPRKQDLEVPETRDDQSKDTSAVEIVIDVDCDGGAAGGGAGPAGGRKDGTNYSRSRVKVSPYRRADPERADHTASSLAANYTGNNTTMEMDITESSFVEQPPDSPYLSGLRAIRGRRSYKPLKEMALRNIGVTRSLRSTTSTASVSVSEAPSRPTAPVVGRKRKPEGEGGEAEGEEPGAQHDVRGKRARLLDRLARPFRGASTPLVARRNAEIVGINTDLPLTAPVASPDTFDPESLKTSTPQPSVPLAPLASPLAGPERERDNKRCSIM